MILSEADRERMGTPHSDLKAALEKSPFPDLSGGIPNATVQDIRLNRAEHLKKLRHLYPIPGPIPNEVLETDHQIPTRDGQIRVRIYKPANAMADDDSRPLIVMFHEGGWRMGDLTDEDLNCRLFARSLGAICVNVDYRLAPEHPFPAGVNDAYDAVKWCAQTASPSSELLPADPRTAGFLVGGSSAGGNFAAVMCQVARDEELDPPLTGQYLSVPALLDETVVPEKWKAEYRSRVESVHDPVLKLNPGGLGLELLPADPRAAGFLVGGSSAGGNFAAVMCQVARDEELDPPLTGQYLSVPALLDETVVPEKWKAEYRSRVESVHDPVLKLNPGEDRNQRRLDVLKVQPDDPKYSPLLHENLDGLPPAFFQIAGLDPLRDEGLLFERELRERGTPTRLEVYDGFGHMFWTNWPTLQQSKDFVTDTLEGVKWLLQQRSK